MKPKDNALVAAKPAPPPELAARFREHAGKGLSQAGAESMPLPFLRVLQDLSDVVKKSKPDYIEGAEPGMFFQTAGRNLFPGTPGILLIPFHYEQRFVEWEPNGGGFVAEHAPSSDVVKEAIVKARGALQLVNGDNDLMDTRYHFCVQVYPEDTKRWDVVLVTMASSQIKYSKRWVAEMRGRRFWDEESSGYVDVPTYGTIYSAVSFLDANKAGQEYHSWKLGRVKDVTNEKLLDFCALQCEQAERGAFKTDFSEQTAEAQAPNEGQAPKQGETQDGTSF